jgi:uncharacterized protein (DUF1800 family)
VRSTERPPYLQIGKVEFVPAQHDFGRKEFLGTRIPAVADNAGPEAREHLGRRELERVLQIVVRHPATAQHLGTKLCRHFIADTPPPAAVAQAASVFQKTAGDIKAVLRAIFSTEEFWQAKGSKFKRPFTFVASALRATGAKTDAGLALIEHLKRMGHAPFNYPTPDGYPDQAAPWVGTLLWRWKFALALSQNRIEGTRVDFDTLRKHAGGDDKVIAHLLGRLPAEQERGAYHSSAAGLALLLSAPAFQMC